MVEWKLMLMLLNALPNFDAGAIGYWMVGYARLPLNGIGDRLKNVGYPVPKEAAFISGGEGYFMLHRYMVGGGGFRANLFGATSPSYNTDVSLGAGYFGLGYVLFKSRTMLIYPAIGIGGGNLTAIVREERTGEFSDVLKNPPLYAEIKGEGFLAKGGVGLVYTFGPIITGLNVGVTYLRPANWKINGNGTTNYPSGDYTLFWAALNIGGGAW